MFIRMVGFLFKGVENEDGVDKIKLKIVYKLSIANPKKMS